MIAFTFVVLDWGTARDKYKAPVRMFGPKRNTVIMDGVVCFIQFQPGGLCSFNVRNHLSHIRNVKITNARIYFDDAEHVQYEKSKILVFYRNKANEEVALRFGSHWFRERHYDRPDILIQRVFWLPPLPDLVVARVVRFLSHT